LQFHSVAAADCPMLPWALDRTHSDACRAGCAGWVVHPFRRAAPTPHRTSHHPRVVRKARSLALSGSERVRLSSIPRDCRDRSDAPQPEGCATPDRPFSRRRGNGIDRVGSGASRRLHPGRAARTPKGTLEREQKAPRGPPPPVRVTRRCSVPARRPATPKGVERLQPHDPEGPPLVGELAVSAEPNPRRGPGPAAGRLYAERLPPESGTIGAPLVVPPKGHRTNRLA